MGCCLKRVNYKCVKKCSRSAGLPHGQLYMVDGQIFGLNEDLCTSNGGLWGADDSACTDPTGNLSIVNGTIYGIDEHLCTSNSGLWNAVDSSCMDPTRDSATVAPRSLAARADDKSSGDPFSMVCQAIVFAFVLSLVFAMALVLFKKVRAQFARAPRDIEAISKVDCLCKDKSMTGDGFKEALPVYKASEEKPGVMASVKL
ncbi:hypothetical protein P280DRAFT_472475 [Massarina eburnea CBS 473.64]|uniref:Uncharacterized protein n=1 Tax=Massarina eburnea CBS 473.64 TaxID=1395130 RepID=A0A6A6RRU5_9PLEO|nr:hypothetical protein P280DRAFT_472475 [Massarina eburnea CBS 473.64]